MITVKGNQKTLFHQLQQAFEQTPAKSQVVEWDKGHGRQVRRTVSVLPPPEVIDAQWEGVRQIVRIERAGRRSGKLFRETMFYISSLALDAVGFAERIRAHWHIENRLHWVKDVVLKEDSAPLCDGHAPINFAVIRTMAINLLRSQGFDSITQGIRQVAHDINRIFSFCQ